MALQYPFRHVHCLEQWFGEEYYRSEMSYSIVCSVSECRYRVLRVLNCRTADLKLCTSCTHVASWKPGHDRGMQIGLQNRCITAFKACQGKLSEAFSAGEEGIDCAGTATSFG